MLLEQAVMSQLLGMTLVCSEERGHAPAAGALKLPPGFWNYLAQLSDIAA